MSKKIEWTAEIDDFFETLLGQEENLTFKQIAQLMTERFDLPFTKNGCVGRAHRARMPPRAPHRVARKPRKAKVITMPVRVDAPIPPKEALRLTADRALTIYQLQYGDCRYPGNEERPPYSYCGRATRDGASYCPDHHRVVYQTPSKRWS